MVILGIEASGNSASAAVVDGGVCRGTMRLEARYGHAGVLTEKIDAMLKTAGVDYAALQYLAVGCGPGSFTAFVWGWRRRWVMGWHWGCRSMGCRPLNLWRGRRLGSV